MKHLLLSLLIFVSLNACAAGKKTAPVAEPPAAEASQPPAGVESVWVGKSDEAKSCAKEKGVSLDTMAAVLKANDIKILSKKKIPDGKMRIQMCGADKGSMNGYLISKSDLEKAKGIGFQYVPGSY